MRRTTSTAVEQLAIIFGALFAYLAMRIVVEGSAGSAHANAQDVLAFERALGIDWEYASQQWVLDKPSWLAFWNFTYRWLYWPSVALGLVVLWRFDRSRYALLRNALFVSAAAGLVIFAVFPVSPPRFLDGYVDTLHVAGQRIHSSDSVFANVYAAVPSFHVGWPALAGFVVAGSIGRRWVWVLAMTPAVLIAGAVVFTGNHYVVDAIAGIAVVTLAYQVASRFPNAHDLTPAAANPSRNGHAYR